MKRLALSTVAALALMVGSASAAVIKDLGVNPSSATGQFSNNVDGTTFTDYYTFQLVGSPLFITFASATNDFAKTTDFITGFVGQLFQQVGAPGGGDDIPVSVPATPQPCQTNPTGCQVLAGSALLGPGSYYLELRGTGGGTSGYGGNLTTASVVPLPAALPLFATGLALFGGAAAWRKRREKKAVA